MGIARSSALHRGLTQRCRVITLEAAYPLGPAQLKNDYNELLPPDRPEGNPAVNASLGKGPLRIARDFVLRLADCDHVDQDAENGFGKHVGDGIAHLYAHGGGAACDAEHG